MGTPLPTEPWDLPAEDDVAETLLHLMIRILLLETARRWFESQGVRALVGSDQFVYWQRNNPHRVVAPDLYVALGADPDRSVRVWKTWDDGVPDLALEVVSDDVDKDYLEGPRRYAELGVRELVIYDPLAAGARGRRTFQVFRRDEAGEFVRAELLESDQVWSEVLGCWLRHAPDPDTGQPRLRLATGDGSELIPTAKEAEQAAREANEALHRELERLREELARRE